MEEIQPTPMNRTLATVIGIAAGVGVQMLFLFIATNIIGPIPNGFNGKLLEWILLLLAPPILSFAFLRIAPGSVSEDMFKGFQLGALAWFLIVLASLLF
jgi:hypothetical protein